MRALLDSHALVWWITGSDRLPHRARAIIEDSSNILFVSAASVWEIATKVRLGRIPHLANIAADLPRWISRQRFQSLSVDIAHGQLAGWLPGPHQDPFDRMLIAQAQAENLAIISNEEIFDSYGVRRIW